MSGAVTSNPWVAVDATRPLSERARELGRAWDHFLERGVLRNLRLPIAQSWQRSYAAGVDPSGEHPAPVLADEDETQARWEAHVLATTAPILDECLGSIAADGTHLVAVSNDEGMVLSLTGASSLRRDAAQSINFVEGLLLSDPGAGTNAIGVALASDHAVQVFATEHYCERVHGWTCAAAPIHDPDTGQILGVIDLTGRMHTAHPHNYAVVVATARAAEGELRRRMQERDARLRSRYSERIFAPGGERRALVNPTGRVLEHYPDGWVLRQRLAIPPGGGELELASGGTLFAEPVFGAFIVREVHREPRRGSLPLLRLALLGHDPALVEFGGTPLKLSRRQTELLALLAVRPSGMMSDELAVELYGDDGQPNAVRVEVHRLRKLLGRCISTVPYRLTANVESDLAHLRGLLEDGQIRAAAERYEGPLLPRSDAPGIVREREDMEAWLRRAVMTSDDPEALWAWTRTSSGADDLPAWTRLLSQLGFRDPRRSLAAARTARLRQAYAA